MKAIFAIASTLLILLPHLSHAEIYKWTDDKGGVHFTENPSTIPEKHRDSTKSRPTKEEGMTIEQRRQENKRSEAEAAKQIEKEQIKYQKSIEEDGSRSREKQIRDQAEERRITTEQKEKARSLQTESKPEYVREGCQACLGKGQIRCYNCKGTGYDSAMHRRCPFCEGAGWKRCSDCNGKGIIMKRIR